MCHITHQLSTKKVIPKHHKLFTIISTNIINLSFETRDCKNIFNMYIRYHTSNWIWDPATVTTNTFDQYIMNVRRPSNEKNKLYTGTPIAFIRRIHRKNSVLKLPLRRVLRNTRSMIHTLQNNRRLLIIYCHGNTVVTFIGLLQNCKCYR